MAALRRLQKEWAALHESPLPPAITLDVDEDDLFTWRAKIAGPENTPYEGGVFCVRVNVPKEYPMHSPLPIFETKLYHPNINAGNVCSNMLKDSWSPRSTMKDVFEMMLKLLKEPDAEDPLVPDIARQFKRDRAKFDETAREWTNKYAKEKEKEKENVKKDKDHKKDNEKEQEKSTP